MYIMEIPIMLNTLEDTEINHPRQLLRRQKWQPLNGTWKFRFDHEQKFHHPREVHDWPLTIQVPFVPECPASGLGDTDFHNRCWYQRSFTVGDFKGRLQLNFGAVDYVARVWVNDQYIGSHEGGHTPFTFDITDFLNPSGAEQILTVCADDDPHDLTKPRGKQDWQREPHSIWYPRSSGIWQTVWLEEVPTTYISALKCIPLLERWEVSCEAFIDGIVRDDLKVEVQLKCRGAILAHDTYKVIHKEVHRRIALSDPGVEDYRNELLWSPERPTLIDVTINLWAGDKLIDHVESYTALRSVSAHADRFLLNGRPYQMRLILDQGYWPDTFMTPPSREAIQKDIELVKAAGFNGVRKHQKIESPDFLYWADRMGLLVWEEMP
ncbi:MAG: glycoside hydrolase family 2, partial [Proteobacteria bacterium]